MSSMPRLEAPSISWTSKLLPSVISTQFSHSLSGLESFGWRQFTAFASSRAVVVFPTPRGPLNR